MDTAAKRVWAAKKTTRPYPTMDLLSPTTPMQLRRLLHLYLSFHGRLVGCTAQTISPFWDTRRTKRDDSSRLWNESKRRESRQSRARESRVAEPVSDPSALNPPLQRQPPTRASTFRFLSKPFQELGQPPKTPDHLPLPATPDRFD